VNANQLIAIGNGEIATRLRVRGWIEGVIQKALEDVVPEYHRAQLAKHEERDDDLPEGI
jgi:hypothetical protein